MSIYAFLLVLSYLYFVHFQEFPLTPADLKSTRKMYPYPQVFSSMGQKQMNSFGKDKN